MARGIALLVGVTSVDPAKYPNGWDGTDGAEGCELDVGNMVKVIPSSSKYEIKTLKKTGEPTSQAILDYIDWAANTLKSGDMFVFYYSGHGGQKHDTNGDEIDGNDETLIVYDREICDDELAGYWLQFKPGVRIVMLSDSCNSGTNDGYIIKVLGAKPPDPPIRKLMPISFTGKLDGMDAQLIHFGACRDGREAPGGMLGSPFTLALTDVWKKNKGKFAGYEQLHEAIKARLKEKGYPQEPQFNPHGNVQPDFLNSKPFSVNIEQA